MTSARADDNGRWNEVLRRAGAALDGRDVVLFEASGGRVRTLAADSDVALDDVPKGELEAAIGKWKARQHPGGNRWVASRTRGGPWCAAPVRRAPWKPPPGTERRSAERMTLELAGLCIGLLDNEEQGWRELDDFFEQAAVGMHIASADGTILRANQAELDMLGYSPEEYIGHAVHEFYDDPEQAQAILRRLQAGETVHNVEIKLRHKDGTVRHALLSSNVAHDEGKFRHTRCVTRDITDRKRAEETLAQLSAIVDSADDAIVGKTLDGIITTWNAGAERLYGYAAREIIGRSVDVLIPPERPDELTSILGRLRRGERVSHYETTRVRKDGSRVYVSITVSPIFDPNGIPVGASAIARDVTEQRRVEEQLLHGATHDPLTDLPNRTYFVEHVAQAMEHARKDPDYTFAVLFLDFDKFKVINDSLGHAAGDHLLREIATRLRNVVRPADVVARFGGDEFTLLLERVTTPSDVARSTRRIYETFTAPFILEGQSVYVTASIGVALSTKEFARPDDLLREADLAMYRAKSRGRGKFQIFDSQMLRHAQERFGTEKDLRAALKQSEFRLVYQPIVELKTGRVRAFEALLRWQHPDRGLVMPLEFIPVAEETGLIVPIGHWVLHEACAQARRWRFLAPGHRSPRISVNLSAKQLGDAHLVDNISEILQNERLDPSCLRLEITETVLVDSVETSADRLKQIHRLGVELHMDDFGTGYSSLSLLPRFPLQTLKIDRSFIRRLGNRRSDQELVRSIVDLARRLGLSMIAEGVETAAQRERLISYGCELGQGFFFAQPLTPDAAASLLESSGRERTR